MKKYFYITTTLPYVNASPHIGHALEFVRADVLARYKKEQGYDVFFNTGTDEHGQKIYEAALKSGVTTQEYVNQNSNNFRLLLTALDISEDIHFVRTTDDKHAIAATEFWKRVNDNGYIYKKRYQSKYCVGCELEKTDSELEDGRCPTHPNLEIELIDEENYFFKFSEFGESLIKFYTENPSFVVPESRFNEIKSFVSRGLEDFSVSRLKEKMSWGIPVPGDTKHVMYVWFDALTSYISTLGWPNDLDNFDTYWKEGTPTQYCGQDNLRQQSAIWQAMLMAAKLPNSNKIIINGFVTGEGGVKMSKTIGNVIDPMKLQEYYGTDALRYYLLRHIHPWDGSPVTYDSFHEAYSAHLVNGLGNLTSRLLTLSEKYLEKIEIVDESAPSDFVSFINDFRFDQACNYIWDVISQIDREISDTEPFKLIKQDSDRAKGLIHGYVSRLYNVAALLRIIMPQTSYKIMFAVKKNKKPTSLFDRKPKISL